jgi:uncharacterized membrane protein
MQLLHTVGYYGSVVALIGLIFLWLRILSPMHGTPRGAIVAKAAIIGMLVLLSVALGAGLLGYETIACCSMFVAIFFAYPYVGFEGKKATTTQCACTM